MAEVVWTDPALQELSYIAEYIALDKPEAARGLVKEVFEAVERLQDFPLSGRTPLELPNSIYRELVVPPCRIFYRVDEGRAFILYLMRGERQLRLYMLGDS
ncbi:MAG: type II toxin-antitoxin system RelE/ParE family toxin [Moraxellaceae bacterium]|nr:type II toxin-antitoxin system RelE/ParE family toxin [Moraxellaceae bacterium]MDZ4386291.1 type II toxin-antitoxin system RelE/ParE family toxin [Moraxellaceae bacterium]